MSYVLQNTPLYLASGEIRRDESIPIESLTHLRLDSQIPIDNQGSVTRIRDEQLPVDNQGTVTRIRDDSIPVESGPVFIFDRRETIPVEWGGIDPNQLLLIWAVRNQLDVPFVLSFNVIADALAQNLALRWTVRQPTVPLTLRWNVVPDLLSPLINNDIQRPVGTATKTP